MTEAKIERRRPVDDAFGIRVVPFTLSLVAGMVDVTSFILLDGLFAAHITGNVVVLAADVATHRPVRSAAVLAIAAFIVVTAALTAAVDCSRRPPYRWASAFLWLQFALLTATAVVAALLDRTVTARPGVELLVALLAVSAMACQNALLHLTFSRAPSTAVMTGNIVGSTVALVGIGVERLRRRSPAFSGPSAECAWEAERQSDRTAWLALWPLLLGFTAGCLVGAVASEVVDRWAWVIPALVGGILAAAVSRTGLPDPLRRNGLASR
jgi:uncharacterized membrane protein YoaK (UPF0700 family)